MATMERPEEIQKVLNDIVSQDIRTVEILLRAQGDAEVG